MAGETDKVELLDGDHEGVEQQPPAQPEMQQPPSEGNPAETTESSKKSGMTESVRRPSEGNVEPILQPIKDAQEEAKDEATKAQSKEEGNSRKDSRSRKTSVFVISSEMTEDLRRQSNSSSSDCSNSAVSTPTADYEFFDNPREWFMKDKGIRKVSAVETRKPVKVHYIMVNENNGAIEYCTDSELTIAERKQMTPQETINIVCPKDLTKCNSENCNCNANPDRQHKTSVSHCPEWPALVKAVESGDIPENSELGKVVRKISESGNVSQITTLTLSQCPPPTKKTKKRHRLIDSGNVAKIKGILLALVTGVLLSSESVSVKLLGDRGYKYPLINAFSHTMLLGYLTLMWVACKRYNMFPQGKVKMMSARSVIGCLGLILQYIAIQELPLSDAQVLFAGFILVTIIVRRLFSSEPVWEGKDLVLVVLLLGILLDSRFLEFRDGVLIALWAAVFIGFEWTFQSQLKDVQVSVVLLNFSFVSVGLIVVLGFCFSGFALPHSQEEWLLLTVSSLMGVVRTLLIASCLNLMPPSQFASMTQIKCISFALIWQNFLYTVPVNWMNILGTVLVLSACVFIVIDERF